MKRNLDTRPELDIVASVPVTKTEVEGRENNEVQFNWLLDKRECRAAQNFIGIRVNGDGTWRGLHGFANGVNPFRAAYGDRFPNLGFTGDWCCPS